VDRRPTRSRSTASAATPGTDESDTSRSAIAGCARRPSRQIVALKPPPELSDEGQLLIAPFLPDTLVIDLSVYEAQKELFDALGFELIGQPARCRRSRSRAASTRAPTAWKSRVGREVHPDRPGLWRGGAHRGRAPPAGLVRDAKDPQRMFNYWRTTSTELVALAPKAPFIGRKGQFETDAASGRRPTPEPRLHRIRRPEPPQRQPFAGVPAGALQEALNASDDMKSIMGLYDASLGAKSNETSGRAIMARQREGDVSTFHYIDNLSRAIRHAGRILLDLIPKVYSTPRIIRVLGQDGTAESVRIV
jgi:hypothetical protein